MSSEPVYLDTELAPIDGVMTYFDEASLADIEAPSNYKDPVKIAEYIEREKVRRREQHVSKAALDPDLCRVVALGAWFSNRVTGQLQATPCLWLCHDEAEEADALSQFWDCYQLGEIVCGFRVREFDLSIIYRRSLYLGVPTKHIDRDRYRAACVLDLFELLNEGRKERMRSLDWYCKRLGLDVPHDDVDGAQIPALVAAGEWEQVRSHLLADLVKTRALARRVVPALREIAA